MGEDNFSTFYLWGESPKYPLKILVKMSVIDFLDKSGTQNMLKCLNNLGVTGFLPPPGLAQAEM